MRKVDLYLTGRVLPDVDAESCAQRLAALAGIELDAARRIVQGGKLVRIKAGVEALAALRYRDTLANIGADVLLRPHGAVPAGKKKAVPRTPPRSATPLTPQWPQQSPVLTAPASPARKRGTANIAPATNPSRHLFAPTNSVSGPRRSPRSRRSREGWRSAPQVVSAGQGWEWFRLSWEMFRCQAFKWLALVYLSGAAFGLALFAPAVHVLLLAVLLVPLFLGAHVAAAYWQDQEDSLQLWASLKTAAKRWKSLTLLGLLTAIFLVLTGALYVFLAGCGAFEQAAASPALFWIFLGLGLILGIMAPPMTSGYFFSIPLLVLGDFRPLRAYQLGVYGSFLNWRAVSLATVVGLLALVILALLVHMVLWLLPNLFWPLFTVLLLGLAPSVVVMGALLAYNACQDIFSGEGD